MKERPIIFSAPMVREILSGAKTQTRRIVKPRHMATVYAEQFPILTMCPFGKPGDRLWVRETWKHIEGGAIYDASGCTIDAFDPETIYRADRPNQSGPWMSPIHMPRWASRITLEITDVRVERLQDISGMDAKREGVSVPAHIPEDGADLDYARRGFRRLWEEIHGGGSWEKNPWVWVIEFKKLEQRSKHEYDQ